MDKLSDIKRISIPRYINSLVDENKKTTQYPCLLARDEILAQAENKYTIGVISKKLEIPATTFAIMNYLRTYPNLNDKGPYVLAQTYANSILHRKAIDDLILYAKECGIIAFKMRMEDKKDIQNKFFDLTAANFKDAAKLTDFLIDTLPDCLTEEVKAPEYKDIYAIYDNYYD